MDAAAKRKWNVRIWVGVALAIISFLSYPVLLVRFPVTRDVPWVNWILFAGALALSWAGWTRARREPQAYRGRILAPILAALTLGITGAFGFGTLYMTRQLPAAQKAPRVGDRAVEFSLPDTTGKTVTLASLLSEPLPGAAAMAKPRGILLIFYRGYW